MSFKFFSHVFKWAMRVDKVSIGSGESKSSKVDLNNLVRKIKEEEKKNKRTNIVISAAAVSAIAVFGIIITL